VESVSLLRLVEGVESVDWVEERSILAGSKAAADCLGLEAAYMGTAEVLGNVVVYIVVAGG